MQQKNGVISNGMQSEEIRSKFLKFFEKRGHKIIPSASLVPENDPSVLFNTAGMQPLVPYLLGEKHPLGKRLVNIQKCVRTQDIDEVGDKTHDTFFEMLGNWSLGDYFKKEAIEWSYELLTLKDEGFGLDPKRLYITVFAGDENAPKDTESALIWKAVGIPGNRIYFMSAKSNWWSAGDNGPCGPDTEMFYDLTGTLGDLTKEEYIKADKEQKIVEIWNDVFMEYEKRDGKVIGKLQNRNVDTGAGLERLATVLQNKDNIFETDLFASTMEIVKNKAKNYDEKSARIVADHIRTSVFMIADGVKASNTAEGYVLRRLLRRSVRYADILGLDGISINELIETIVKKYSTLYANLVEKQDEIKEEILREEGKFRETLNKGLKEFEKGIDPFILATTYGFPIELTLELAKEKGATIDLEDFNKKMAEHQKLSQASSAGMFKGGLADAGEESTKYHTATHLLLAALREVLGEEVIQKGSNITKERMRFDFNWKEKLSKEQLKTVEDLVNKKIEERIPVEMMELPKKDAIKMVRNLSFDLSKYGEIIKIYKIGDFSAEFCGGPHVKNTGELGKFKIQKEEAVAQGIRRIKAVFF